MKTAYYKSLRHAIFCDKINAGEFKTKKVDIVESKFSMTREENIFVAKRNMIDYIWKSAKLEGLGVTYPDTEAIPAIWRK